MAWILRLFIKNDNKVNTPANITKWERLLNWVVTVGVAAWQAIQYIITNHPTH